MQYIGAYVQATINASPDTIWSIISDVRRHAELAGSGHVEKVEVLDPVGLHDGAVFQSSQNVDGLSYTTASRVRVWEPPLRFGWQVGPEWLPGIGQLWYFQLTPGDTGTMVENGVVSPFPLPDLPPFNMIHDVFGRSDVQGLRPTLANLARLLGQPAPSEYTESWRANPSMAARLPSPWLITSGMGLTLLSALMIRRRRS